MVKYSSRVNKPKSKPKKKKMTTQSQPSVTEVFGNDAGGTLQTAGSINTGGVVATGGTLSTGGKISASQARNIKAVVAKAGPVIKAAVQRLGPHLPGKGGVLPTGGAVMTEEQIDNLQYPHVIHALGAMDPAAYHMLQGLAASSLGMMHPMSASLKEHLGGAIGQHPKDISRVATKDIMKAHTPQMLSMALHDEFVDHLKGVDTGGGLFSSLKSLLKKGTAGAGKAAKALARGAKGAVSALSAGAKTGAMVGKSLSGAIQQGINIANVLNPALQAISPAAASAVSAGVESGKALQQGIGRGVKIAEGVSSGLDPILAGLGNPNEPIGF